MNTTIEYSKRFEEELPLILAAKEDCPDAIAKIVEMTFPLRKALAYRFLPNSPSLHEDAIQVGWIGARKALQKWDPQRGVCFINWCRYEICWAIRDFKCKMGKSVARPHWLYRKLTKINHLATENTQELSDLMSCPTHQIEIIQGIRSGDISLNLCDGMVEESCSTSPHLIDNTTPSEQLAKSELITMMMVRTRSLSDRERYVLDARYGLSAGEPLTHSEIGLHLNLTRQRVEQIESESIDKIRSYFERIEKGLRPLPQKKNSRHSKKRRNFCRRNRPTTVSI